MSLLWNHLQATVLSVIEPQVSSMLSPCYETQRAVNCLTPVLNWFRGQWEAIPTQMLGSGNSLTGDINFVKGDTIYAAVTAVHWHACRWQCPSIFMLCILHHLLRNRFTRLAFSTLARLRHWWHSLLPWCERTACLQGWCGRIPSFSAVLSHIFSAERLQQPGLIMLACSLQPG